MAQPLLKPILILKAMNRKNTKDVNHYRELGMKAITALLASATVFIIFYNVINLFN